MQIKSKGLFGFALAAFIALSPAHAKQILFDNGRAVVDAGPTGGAGFNTNSTSDFQVCDNFSIANDSTIETIHFQMAGGTEPFKFAVYADDMGKPGGLIYSEDVNVGDYTFDNYQEYSSSSTAPDGGYDFHFDVKNPLTLNPGNYWISFIGGATSSFYTLGTGPGDGIWLRKVNNGQLVGFRTGDTPFQLVGTPVGAALVFIDIKPGGSPNPINPRSNGVIPVAVLSSMSFDATSEIDIATVAFGPKGAKPSHSGHAEDVNNDGYTDMLFHFSTQDTGIQCGDTEAFLSGETHSGQAFGNSDTITTVGCNDPGPGPGPGPGPDPGPGDGNTDSAAAGSGGSALDWTMLPALLVLTLLRIQRRRIADR